jgi:hypothetical protein
MLEHYRWRVGFRPTPMNRDTREVPLVLSLTTTPGHLGRADIAIATLLTQTLAPDRAILWLSDEVAGEPLPRAFRPLLAAGLEVRHVRDVGPHTKLVHALEAFPDAAIVTADDDMFYPSDWLATLYASYRQSPAHIHCHRAHLMRVDASTGVPVDYMDWDLGAPGVLGPSQLLFPTGVGGVLYPPGSLAPEVGDVEAFQRLCPTADDIWFKAMALLAGTAAVKVAPQSPRYRQVRGFAASALYAENLTRNDPQLRATFEAYDLYPLLREAATGPER